MHPAYSVILFTTASGAGYGLLALLGLGAGLGWLPADRLLGLFGLGIALALITAGLLASTAHLGRPGRAWRALSQWRTSWLSREGVLALAVYLPAGLLGIGWGWFGHMDFPVQFCALLSAVLAVLTVIATGMIYQSLPTIRQWHQPLTASVYLALSVASGAMLLSLLLGLLGLGGSGFRGLTAGSFVAAGVLKWLYWRAIDSGQLASSPESATGLGQFGKVRQLDPPHTQANFVMREMGYTIARKHALSLRRFVLALLFAIPAVSCAFAAIAYDPVAEVGLAIGALSAAAGVLTERWLFFAEAEHVVMNYYGK